MKKQANKFQHSLINYIIGSSLMFMVLFLFPDRQLPVSGVDIIPTLIQFVIFYMGFFIILNEGVRS
jgi:hypothetical protein